MTELLRGALAVELEPLGFLLGSWSGQGTASYPTMERDVAYAERLVFEHVGDPFLLYVQESWALDDGTPLHFERGSLRPGGEDALELVLAHPAQGVTEIAHGRLHGTSFELSTEEGAVANTKTGDHVIAVERRYRVWGDVLTYEVRMGTASVETTLHLVAELRRDA